MYPPTHRLFGSRARGSPTVDPRTFKLSTMDRMFDFLERNAQQREKWAENQEHEIGIVHSIAQASVRARQNNDTKHDWLGSKSQPALGWKDNGHSGWKSDWQNNNGQPALGWKDNGNSGWKDNEPTLGWKDNGDSRSWKDNEPACGWKDNGNSGSWKDNGKSDWQANKRSDETGSRALPPTVWRELGPDERNFVCKEGVRRRQVGKRARRAAKKSTAASSSGGVTLKARSRSRSSSRHRRRSRSSASISSAAK